MSLKLLRRGRNSLMQIKVKVRLEHYDRHGRLKKVVTKESDRVLNNFGYLLKVIFIPVNSGNYITVSGFVDELGNAKGVIVGYDNYCWDYAYASERKYYVEIGTSNVAPANDDYKLGSFHNRAVANIYSLDLGSDYIRITLRASVQATANVTIWEVGLSLRCPTLLDYCLLFRDVLSEGISMLSGEYLAVYYTIEFTR